MWPAKISLFGACTGDSLILLVSATLVRAKIPPWISPVEGRRGPSHRSKAFHGSTLPEAVWRWWWSLGTTTSAEQAGRKKTGKNKGQLKAIGVDSDSTRIPHFQLTSLQTFTLPKASPQSQTYTGPLQNKVPFPTQPAVRNIGTVCTTPQTTALCGVGEPSKLTFPFPSWLHLPP